MTLQRRARVIAVVLASLSSSVHGAEADVPQPSRCAVTRPGGGVLANDSLEVVLQDKFVFKPGGPGFVDDDGALGMKVGWGLREKGTLIVTGRRLDREAPPARAYIHRAYDDYVGGMGLYIVFPTPGCWEITGALDDASLTFVVEVEKIGESPDWRMHGVPPGARMTGG